MRFLVLFLTLSFIVSGCSRFNNPRNSERFVEQVNDIGGWVSEQLSGTGKAKPPAELVEFTPEFEPIEAWDKNLSGGFGRGFPKPIPAIDDQQITLVDDNRRALVSWSAKNIEKLWTVSFDDKLAAGVGFDSTRLLVATRNAELQALSRATGELIWQTQMPSEVLAPPVSNGEVVVVTTSDGKLIGLDASDGLQKWMIERDVPALSLRGSSTPLILGDMVIKGFADGRLVAVNIDNGFEAWDVPIGLPRGRNELSRMVDSDSSPVADAGVIFTAAYQGRVVAVGQNSGEILWSRTLSSYSDISVDLFNIYITDDQDTVWALDRRSGATYWKQDALSARQVSSPVVIGDYIVVADFEGYLHWLDRDDGSFVARSKPIKDSIGAPLKIINDKLYVFSDSGRLVVLLPPTDEIPE